MGFGVFRYIPTVVFAVPCPHERLEIFDEKEPKKFQLEKILDIYQHNDRIRAALKTKLG